MTAPGKAKLVTLYSTAANLNLVNVNDPDYIQFNPGETANHLPPMMILSVNNPTPGDSFLIDFRVGSDSAFDIEMSGSHQTVKADNGHLILYLDGADAGWHGLSIRGGEWFFFSCEITRLN